MGQPAFDESLSASEHLRLSGEISADFRQTALPSAFRSKLDPQAEHAQSQLRLEKKSPLHRASERCAQEYERVFLDPMPQNLPVSGMRMNQKLAVLPKLPSDKRLHIVRETAQEMLTQGRISRRMKSLLHKMLSYLNPHERTQFVRFVFNEIQPTHGNERAALLIGLTLQASENFQELKEVIQTTGKERCLALKNSELKNLIAKSVVGERMRQMRRPKRLATNAAAKPVRRRLDQIKAHLEERIAECRSHRGLVQTDTARRFIRTAEDNLEYLRSERARRRTTKARRELANGLIDMIGIEFQYNIHLSFEREENRHAVSQWTEKDLHDLNLALRRLPEGLLLFTPKLQKIVRQEGTDSVTYGDRTGSGSVRVNDMAIDEEESKAKFHNISSLITTIVHELGHSIKFGAWGDGKTGKSHISEIARESNPLFDLGDFLKLSKWEVIPRDAYRIQRGGDEVIIDGKAYPIGVPTRLDGQVLTLVYDSEKRTLYSYDALAEFAIHPYGRASPWEDYAESFSEYILIPQRLIRHAPLKFLYFEQQFHKYRDSDVVQEKLRKGLASREIELPSLSYRNRFDGRLEAQIIDGPNSCKELEIICYDRAGNRVGEVTVIDISLERAKQLRAKLHKITRTRNTDDPLASISHLRDFVEGLEQSHAKFVSHFGATREDIVASYADALSADLSIDELQRFMTVSEILPNVVYIHMPTQYLLSSTFLRFQEHFESEGFRGKVFTAEEFQEWYRGQSPSGGFSYYEDWDGFNVPDYCVTPFQQGEFAELSNKERALLGAIGDRKQPYYVIGYYGAQSEDTKQHEMAHALFYTQPEYKQEILSLLQQVDVTTIEEALKEFGYIDQVLNDEVHAALLDGADVLESWGIDSSPYHEIIRSVRSVFLRYVSKLNKSPT